MTALHRRLVEDFFARLSAGTLADDMFTADMMFWSWTGGEASKERFLGGVKMLQSLFPSGLAYAIDAIVADDARAAAEVQSSGVLESGESFHNVHVFTFGFRDGRIASVKEYQNPDPVRAFIVPGMQAKLKS